MKPVFSLQHLQETTTEPSKERNETNQTPFFFKIHSNIIPQSTPKEKWQRTARKQDTKVAIYLDA
jgi:hypothetical protein